MNVAHDTFGYVRMDRQTPNPVKKLDSPRTRAITTARGSLGLEIQSSMKATDFQGKCNMLYDVGRTRFQMELAVKY